MSGTVLAVAAVVSAGAAVYNAYQSGETAHQARGMARTTFAEQQQYAQMLNKLISDPSSVSQLPGYQFQMQQGTQAVARGMGAQGIGGSAAEQMALMQYGQGLAQSFYGQQTQLLASLSGLQAAASPAQYQGTAIAAQQQQTQDISNLFGDLGLMYMMGKMGPAATTTAGTPASPPASPYSAGYPAMSYPLGPQTSAQDAAAQQGWADWMSGTNTAQPVQSLPYSGSYPGL